MTFVFYEPSFLTIVRGVYVHVDGLVPITPAAVGYTDTDIAEYYW